MKHTHYEGGGVVPPPVLVFSPWNRRRTADRDPFSVSRHPGGLPRRDIREIEESGTQERPRHADFAPSMAEAVKALFSGTKPAAEHKGERVWNPLRETLLLRLHHRAST